MFRWFVLLAVLLLTAVSARGATPEPPAGGTPIVIGRSYTIHSAVLGDERRLNVFLPDDYGDGKQSYPVLYLLDGGADEDFHHVTGLARINAAYGFGQPVIVVGIEGKDRRHDLTSPTTVAEDLKRAPTSGGAAAYRRFLIEDVKPWVAAHYRTSGRSGLIGESLAGLFTLETLLVSPRAFDDYISVSPSLWWNGGALSREAASDLKAHDYAGKRAFIAFDEPAPPADVAARERAEQNAVQSAFQTVRPPGLAFFIERPGETHGSIYHPAATKAFRLLYPPPKP